MIDEAEGLCLLHPCRLDVDADHDLGAAPLGEHRRSHSDRAEPDDQHAVRSGDVSAQHALIGGADATGDEAAVAIGERLRQGDQVALLGHEVLGAAAVPLPAIGGPRGVGAGNLIALAAASAEAAPRDVIDGDPVPFLEMAAARAEADDLAGGLVPADDVHIGGAVGLRALVPVIDEMDIGSADAGRLDLEQHLADARLGHRHLAQHHGRIAGEERTHHRLGHFSLMMQPPASPLCTAQILASTAITMIAPRTTSWKKGLMPK